MKWILIKALFVKTDFKKIIAKFDKRDILYFQAKAVLEENYELAAYLGFYLEFKFKLKKHEH